MKKKMLRFLLIVFLSLELTGCGVKYPDLKDNAIAFDMGEYVHEDDDEAYYGTIEYNGRTCIPYGTLKNVIAAKNINKCIGYIIQNENSSSIIDENNKDTRIYTLIEDPEENYLMEYYLGTIEMNQPYFWRAVDTKDKDLNTPTYIDSLEYNFWK